MRKIFDKGNLKKKHLFWLTCWSIVESESRKQGLGAVNLLTSSTVKNREQFNDCGMPALQSSMVQDLINAQVPIIG